MMSSLVRFSIRFSGVIIGLACLVLLYGIYTLTRSNLDVFPEFSPTQIIIQTESPGLSAELVESLVSQPIESSIAGSVGIKSMRSQSIPGLSIVTVIFDEQTDIFRNRQVVAERLATLNNKLPPSISPNITPLTSSASTVLGLGVTSKARNLTELRTLVDWTIVPHLLAIPGVADVNVFGGKIRQLQIQVDPEKMIRYGVSLTQIEAAVKNATGVRGNGFIENKNQRIIINTEGQLTTPEQLAKATLFHKNGQSVRLGDIGKVILGATPSISAAAINEETGVYLSVQGQLGANTYAVTQAIEKSLQEIKPALSAQNVTLHEGLFRPANFIEVAIHGVRTDILIGSILVITVLFLFLFNVRTAIISATAIPLSLLTAIVVMSYFNIGLNIMVLGGLAIALGEVVDDAIIDTENIFRRLRENGLLSKPMPIVSVVYNASLEVRSSVVYASFIVALAFVPLLTLNGVAGRLFAPLGYSYILAILVSLLVALTLTPALCFTLLGQHLTNSQDPPLIKYLKPLYKKLLVFVFNHANKMMLTSIIICLLSLLTFSKLDSKFLPELREGHYIVHTTSLPGTSLQESLRIGSQLTQQFMTIPGIQSVSQWAGRAQRGADTYGSHYSEYEVRLEPLSGAEQQQILDQLRDKLSQFPGILYEANTFLTERIDETISGYTAPVVVNLYGNDLNELDTKAQALAKIMQEIPGAANVQLRSPLGTPLMQINVDLDQLGFWGVMPAQVVNTLQAAYETQVVGKQFIGNKLINIAVALAPELRLQPEAIALLPIRTKDGLLVRLEQVAEIRHTASRYNILHQGSQRRQTVTCSVLNRDMDAFMQELKARVLKDIPVSEGSLPEFTGAGVEQAQARKELIIHSLLAGIGVLIFIYSAISSLRNTALALLNLPFALMGGIVAVVISGATLSVGSIVGFITLFGITVRNSIMLVSHYRYLVEVEGRGWNRETVILGAQERLPSILMTALVTALAMLPIAFNSDNPGREIMGPMAAIIIGGLTSSTLLNLCLLPTILLKYGLFRNGHESK